jgi:hypothetical protein
MVGTTDRGPLRAALRKVGDVYRAEYLGELNPDQPDARALPDSHIGTEAAEVRAWVEQMARGLGYSAVNWDDTGEPARERRFTSPVGMPGQRENLPAGTLVPPHLGRHGDEQRQPSPQDLAVTGKVQRDIGLKSE